MKPEIIKNLAIITFLLLFGASLWVLNQRKSFNPVLSLKTNLSFKSKKNLDYNSLSSVFLVYSLLKNYDNNFVLNPILKEVIGDLPNENKQFTVVGRTIKNSDSFIEVYEYANSDKANLDYKRLQPFYQNNIILFKNLIVKLNDQKYFNYLTENLK